MKKTVYCVGNAHLDPAWMWRWQEGSAEAKATLRSALDRMNEFDDFKFVCSSASVFEWIEEFDKPMFEEIKQRIAEGRFIIVGGWYVQPDCNIPSGEGFARQSLYSQRYFKEKFGVTATIGYNVDSFGHNGNIPQILRKSGMDSYIFMRPMQHEKEMNSNLFWWIAPDGSKVLAYRISGCYCFKFTNQAVLKKELEFVSSKAPQNIDCAPFFYGVGNHGGGPTIKHIQLLEEFDKNSDTHIVFSTLRDFFTELREQKTFAIPEHKDDLQHHASGCYSAFSPIKTAVRRAETHLISAETLSMLASCLLHKPYQTKTIAYGWKNVNFLHFHDIMGGCCIKDAYSDTLDMASESTSLSVKIINNCLQSLSWAIDTSKKEDGLPVIFFNPHPFDIETLAKVNRQATSVHDAQGKSLTYQYVFSQTHLCARRCDTLFRIKVPALGYATYYLNRENAPSPLGQIAPEIGRIKYAVEHLIPLKGETFVGCLSMEDSFFKVTFDNKTGYLSSIYDKKNGRELLGKSEIVRKKLFSKKVACTFGGIPTVIDEKDHDTWSHGKNYFDKVCGYFGDPTFCVLEKEPLRSMIKVCYTYQKSSLTQYYILENDGLLRVKGQLDWQEKQKMLKINFPLNLSQTTSLYEIPFGFIERPTNGEEECGQMWVAVQGKEGGVALLNNNKYSFSVKDNVLSLTAIRSPYFGDHGAPFVSKECELTDQGITEFEYALTLFDGNKAEVTKKARHFNFAIPYVVENNHKGTLQPTYQGIKVSEPNVLISCFKRSEDDTGLVLRLYETDGKDTSVCIEGNLLPCPLQAHITPYSVDTYYLKDGSTEWKYTLMTEYEE